MASNNWLSPAKLMRVLGPIATEISFVGNFWSPFAIILGASIMCPTEKGHKRVCCRQDERQPWGNGDKLRHLPSPTYGYLPYSAKWLLSFNKLQAGAPPALPAFSTRGQSTLDGAAGSRSREQICRKLDKSCLFKTARPKAKTGCLYFSTGHGDSLEMWTGQWEDNQNVCTYFTPTSQTIKCMMKQLGYWSSRPRIDL